MTWGVLLRGGNLRRMAVLAGGVGLHAVNIFIVNTILPSVVAEIGGAAYYAWNTTLFVTASIVGSAATVPAVRRLSTRGGYRLALVLFVLGSAVCAAAPSMAVLLAGRTLQGGGGGMLVALSFSAIRGLFPQPLWARAISLVSGMWGTAALAGPFVGGVFAELGSWRGAFWVLVPLVAAFVPLVERVIPRGTDPGEGGSLPWGRLSLLACAVLAISVGGMGEPGAAALGLAAGVVLTGLMLRLDAAALHRLLPHRALDPRTPLGAAYATMALLVVGTTTIIFVPLILQVVHGLSPLTAGYLSVTESLAWTAAALSTSAAGPKAAARIVRTGPWLMAAGLAGLSLALARGPVPLAVVMMMLVGAGIGMVWAHLAALVMATAPSGERDLAASSISTNQMIATAVGSALGGLTVNLAGLAEAVDAATVERAARWLFAAFAAAPAAAGLLALRLGSPPPPAGEPSAGEPSPAPARQDRPWARSPRGVQGLRSK
ncbi:MAG TPA: MFS transporter, partial [Arenibaculum sp.]|nr:MFS transporter [Arenibaculum sp.]